jgi:hypothetical protein
MVKFTKPSQTSHHPSNARNLFYIVEEEKPRTCGTGVVDKVLRMSASSSSRERNDRSNDSRDKNQTNIFSKPAKIKTDSSNTRYKPVPEGPLSPISQTGSGEDKNKKLSTVIPDPSSDVDMIQFDPEHMLTRNEDDTIEVTHIPGNAKESRATVFSNFEREIEAQESPTSARLSLITKEFMFDEAESKEIYYKQEAETRRTLSEKNASSNNSEALVAMRELALRQKAKLKKVEAANDSFRVELAQQRSKVCALEKEKEDLEEKLQTLETRKLIAESEAACLREQMKVMQGEICLLKNAIQPGSSKCYDFGSAAESDLPSDDESSIDEFTRALISGPLNVVGWGASKSRGQTVGAQIEEIYGESYSKLVLCNRDDSDSLDETRNDVVQTKRQLDDQREAVNFKSEELFLGDTSESFYDRAEGNELVSYARGEAERSEARTEGSEPIDPKYVSTAQIGMGRISALKPTKEDVALFRQRLEVIQKRRIDRRTERDKKANRNAPVVRFE